MRYQLRYPHSGALSLVIGCVLALSPVITATAQPHQCASPNPGKPLPIDLPLPHDLTTGIGVGIALVDTGAASPGVIPGRVENSLGSDHVDHFDHCSLHGTAVAGVLHTVAPGALIISHQQATENGTGTVEGLVNAIERATEQANSTSGPPSSTVRVINISLVACQDTNELRSAITTAQNAGLLVVAAAGNAGQCPEGEPPYPAALPGVLTVGGVDTRMPPTTTLSELGAGRRRAEYSIPGPWVDLFAPGGPVSTVLSTGAAETTIIGDPNPFIGTSFAAPVVSASAALLWQLRPELSATQVRELLIATSQPGMAPVVDPVAAATILMDSPQVPLERAVREPPWPRQIAPAPDQESDADLRLPVALATLTFLAVVSKVVVHRQSTAAV